MPSRSLLLHDLQLDPLSRLAACSQTLTASAVSGGAAVPLPAAVQQGNFQQAFMPVTLVNEQGETWPGEVKLTVSDARVPHLRACCTCRKLP